jgi:hypothetical protein
MDMMDNAKRVAHMPTATIIEAGIRFKIGLKLPTRVHDEAIFLGAAASLLCAPAIVRATSLMPVRNLMLPIERPWAGFCERLFYHSLECDLRAG